MKSIADLRADGLATCRVPEVKGQLHAPSECGQHATHCISATTLQRAAWPRHKLGPWRLSLRPPYPGHSAAMQTVLPRSAQGHLKDEQQWGPGLERLKHPDKN